MPTACLLPRAAVPVCAHVALALYDADACHQLVRVVLVHARATLALYDYVYLSPCVCIHAHALACCVHIHGCSLYCFSPGSSVCCCPSTTTHPGTSCLSPCTHTRMRAAVCCLHDVPSMYLGAACAAAPPRRRSRVRCVCRRVCMYSYEQLCAASLACRVYTGVQLVLRLPWGQLVLLLLRGYTTGYVLFVAVHAYTHASSCVLSP